MVCPAKLDVTVTNHLRTDAALARTTLPYQEALPATSRVRPRGGPGSVVRWWHHRGAPDHLHRPDSGRPVDPGPPQQLRSCTRSTVVNSSSVRTSPPRSRRLTPPYGPNSGRIGVWHRLVVVKRQGPHHQPVPGHLPRPAVPRGRADRAADPRPCLRTGGSISRGTGSTPGPCVLMPQCAEKSLSRRPVFSSIRQVVSRGSIEERRD